MTRFRNDLRVRCVLGLAALLAVCVPSGTAQAAPASCQGADIPVTGVVPATMHGTLCVPAGGTADTVMVLVPGGTYNHTYWDFPYQPQTYNFRQAMNGAGYATLVVDRLGTGASSRPPSALVTASVQAGAVHQVIQALRGGRIGGTDFRKVILGGHSLGSLISVIEAGTYNDADAVVLTGITHRIVAQKIVDVFISSFYPAALDPAFAGRSYDPGYLTTRPGTRGTDFYAPATTDPAVLAKDEATKDVFSTAEAADGLGVAALLPYSRQIQHPVLLAVGDRDRYFCDPLGGNCTSAAALKAQEDPYFGSAACLHTYVQPGAGHDLNLATNTVPYQRAVRDWADTFVGAGPEPVAPPAKACV
ncbi:alpha/beta fold hydrolase [Streptomyces sp. UNOB3_S3]|uniref:alpha/beta fold hydrolase n=1 Tax=Streptomyces sp. UNOB3_S3 TaxID=2871682 RepID=UPI001E647BBD|nr:alpha/beta fold hydrolase [Streptomyces sp. UNOB3_S3]MCC3774493.1 alpha/beta hydrolase [Streptomyces sp. UNOB3_S3]